MPQLQPHNVPHPKRPATQIYDAFRLGGIHTQRQPIISTSHRTGGPRSGGSATKCPAPPRQWPPVAASNHDLFPTNILLANRRSRPIRPTRVLDRLRVDYCTTSFEPGGPSSDASTTFPDNVTNPMQEFFASLIQSNARQPPVASPLPTDTTP